MNESDFTNQSAETVAAILVLALLDCIWLCVGRKMSNSSHFGKDVNNMTFGQLTNTL
jgi:hypothetical protein